MALEKAVITNTVTNERVPVLFNPEEYTLSKDNNFAQVGVPGLSAPILQFVHGNMQTLEMELLVDTYEEHKEGNRTLNQAGEDVRNLTRKITDLMDIDPTTHAPPVLIFTPVVSLPCGRRCILHLRAGAGQPTLHHVPAEWHAGARPAAR